MNPALLLVDLQNDYLERQPLTTPLPQFITHCERLLSGFRRAGLPVFHIHTLVRTDGSDRMPHWKRKDYWACVEHTRGCESPVPLRPQEGETIIHKTFYSGFQNPDLERALSERRAGPLIVAGVHLHACVCATVLDAYQRGHEIWIASDAVAAMDPRYWQTAYEFLNDRAAIFLTTAEILSRVGVEDVS